MIDWIKKLAPVTAFVVSFWPWILSAIGILLILGAILWGVNKIDSWLYQRDLDKRGESIQKLEEESKTSEDRLQELGTNSAEAKKKVEEIQKGGDRYKGTTADELERKAKEYDESNR